MKIQHELLQVVGVSKRFYEMPKMVRVGTVAEMTAAGSGKTTENINQGNCTLIQKNKPCS